MGSIDSFKEAIWSKKLNIALEKAGVMSECVNTYHEEEIKSRGQKVNINSVGEVLTRTYAGSGLTYDELESEQLTLEVDQQKYFAFKVEDIAKVQSSTELTKKYVAKAKTAIELGKDTFLLSKRADVHADNILTEIVPTPENIYSICVKLRKKLRDQGALNQKSRDTNDKKPWLVGSTDVEELILLSPQYATRGSALVDKTIREGSVYDFAGFDVMIANNVKAINNKVEMMAGINDAITYAGQITKMEALRDKDSFSDLVRGLYVYGALTLLPKGLAKVSLDLTPPTT